jgi:hypothetical protein
LATSDIASVSSVERAHLFAVIHQPELNVQCMVLPPQRLSWLLLLLLLLQELGWKRSDLVITTKVSCAPVMLPCTNSKCIARLAGESVKLTIHGTFVCAGVAGRHMYCARLNAPVL